MANNSNNSYNNAMQREYERGGFRGGSYPIKTVVYEKYTTGDIMPDGRKKWARSGQPKTIILNSNWRAVKCNSFNNSVKARKEGRNFYVSWGQRPIKSITQISTDGTKKTTTYFSPVKRNK